MVFVTAGLSAHHTDEGLIHFTEEFQKLLVFFTCFLPRWVWEFFGYFNYGPQLPVRLEFPFLEGVPALGAGIVGGGFGLLEVLSDAGSAEIVSTLENHRIVKISQANGTENSLLELFYRACGGHGTGEREERTVTFTCPAMCLSPAGAGLRPSCSRLPSASLLVCCDCVRWGLGSFRSGKEKT